MTVPTAVQSGLAERPATIALAMLGDDLPARLLATDEVPTALAWLERLERSWSEVVALVNEPTARVWRLRMVGSALTFEERRMGVDQVLAVRPTVDGVSRVPERRVAWEITGA